MGNRAFSECGIFSIHACSNIATTLTGSRCGISPVSMLLGIGQYLSAVSNVPISLRLWYTWPRMAVRFRPSACKPMPIRQDNLCDDEQTGNHGLDVLPDRRADPTADCNLFSARSCEG